MGLKRVGAVKDMKTIEYIGLDSFDCFVKYIEKKMDAYNISNPGSVKMTFENIHIDHIKPAREFARELNHYTNLQPLLPSINQIKKAKWSKVDDKFWHDNIRDNNSYTEIYTVDEMLHKVEQQMINLFHSMNG